MWYFHFIPPPHLPSHSQPMEQPMLEIGSKAGLPNRSLWNTRRLYCAGICLGISIIFLCFGLILFLTSEHSRLYGWEVQECYLHTANEMTNESCFFFGAKIAYGDGTNFCALPAQFEIDGEWHRPQGCPVKTGVDEYHYFSSQDISEPVMCLVPRQPVLFTKCDAITTSDDWLTLALNLWHNRFIYLVRSVDDVEELTTSVTQVLRNIAIALLTVGVLSAIVVVWNIATSRRHLWSYLYQRCIHEPIVEPCRRRMTPGMPTRRDVRID